MLGACARSLEDFLRAVACEGLSAAFRGCFWVKRHLVVVADVDLVLLNLIGFLVYIAEVVDGDVRIDWPVWVILAGKLRVVWQRIVRKVRAGQTLQDHGRCSRPETGVRP